MPARSADIITDEKLLLQSESQKKLLNDNNKCKTFITVIFFLIDIVEDGK